MAEVKQSKLESLKKGIQNLLDLFQLFGSKIKILTQ